MHSIHTRLIAGRRLVVLGSAFALSVLSCGREPTAPGGGSNGAVRYSQGLSWIAQWPSGVQQFQTAGGSGVAFTKVRVRLNNPDGTLALDTLIAFPAGATELQVTLSVALAASAPASGQPLTLNLDYQNAAGETVFHGGPVTVIAVPAVPGAGPPPPSTVPINITYTGPGANAASVRITPKAATVAPNSPFSFSAQALDASGAVLPNTPIVFTVVDPAFASINAATGAGTAGSVRGSTSIIAQLLTGPTDAATLSIVPPPALLALVSGGGQNGNVNATLTNPVVVRVTASDGIGAAGVAVNFAVGSGGGTVGTASTTTDANGNAQTTWKLGATAGAQTLTATSAGLSGSPLAVSATARALEPVRVAFAVQPPASTGAGVVFAPSIVVNAVDATGAVTPAFTGPVTLALAAGAPAGAVLSGTTTVNAVGGVATFTDLSLNRLGAYTMTATASGLTAATSNAFTVTAGTANRLVFQGYPIIGAVAGTPFDPITVDVRDALNNPVTTFTGPVTLALEAATALRDTASGTSAAANPAGASTANATLSGTTTVNAVAGVATFSGIALTTAGSYRLIASATGLSGATGPSFAITPGPASTLTLVGGGGQTAPGSATLPIPISVLVTDRFGNAAAGTNTVTFTPTAGSVSAPTVVTTAGGAQTVWTLGPFAGVQTLNITSPGLSPNPLAVTATATTTSGVPHTWTGATSTSWTVTTNWSPATVPSGADPVTIPTGTPNAPSISAPAGVGNLTIASGAQVTNTSTLTVSGSLVASGYNVIIGGGTLVLNGASGTIAGGVAGNVTISTGAYTTSGFTEVMGNLVITSNGSLEVGTQEVKVHTDLSTTSGGRLKMTSGAGYATVMGNATFAGGSETGLLTAGTLYLDRNFAASGTAFTASGTHVTRFDGNHAGTQTITYSPSAGSGFNHAVFEQNDAKVLAGAPVFLGNVDILATSPPVTGAVSAKIGGNFSDASLDTSLGGWQVANTNFFGTNKIINSGFITSNVTVSGTVQLTPCGLSCAVLQASILEPSFVQINGDLTVSGAGAVLKVNGTEVDVTGNFATASGGSIDMTNPSDWLYVYGSAVFGGGSTAGKLINSRLTVVQDFTQSGAADSFAPGVNFYTQIGEYYLPQLRAQRSRKPATVNGAAALKAAAAQASHAAREQRLALLRAQRAERRAEPDRRAAAYARRGLIAPPRSQVAGGGVPSRANTSRSIQAALVYTGTSNVSFANPTSSFFGRLYLAGPQTNILSDITVTGMLETGISFTHYVSSATPRTLTSHGADVRNLAFDNVRWVLLDGSDVWGMDYVSFENMDPAVDQFTVSRTSDELAMCDCSSYYTLWYWSFLTTPTSGHYIRITDTNGPPNVTSVWMDYPFPAYHGGYVATAGGATIQNWLAVAPTFTWTGATSTTWNVATNWSGGTIPTSVDDVIIPAAPVNQPVIDVTSYAHNLTIEAGASIDTNCRNFFVYGNVVAALGAPAVVSCDGDALNLVGDGSAFNTVVGNFDLVNVTGPYKVSGTGNRVIANYELTIDGTGNLDINGGRLDAGTLTTNNGGTLTMANPADQVFINGGGATFSGGNTNGLLTAGTMTFTVYAQLYVNSASAFAPSGTHSVVFAGTSHNVYFVDPTMSYFQDVTVNGGTTLALATFFNANGTLTRGAGASPMVITSVAGSPLISNVAGLNVTGGPTTLNSAGLRLLTGAVSPALNTVTFTGFAGFTGPILSVNRNSPSSVTFNGLDFSGVGVLGTGGVFLNNSSTGTVNIRGSNPGTGTLGTHYTSTGGGTVSWIP